MVYKLKRSESAFVILTCATKQNRSAETL